MRKPILNLEQNDDEAPRKNDSAHPTSGYWTPSGYTSTPTQGVNVVLAGAMMSGIILIMFVLCYCCHKTDRKSESHLSSYGRYPDLPLEVFTVGSARNGLDSEALTADPEGSELVASPPPAYETVMSLRKDRSAMEEPGELPTYEYAVRHLDGPWH